MPSRPIERSNEAWLADLRSTGRVRDRALLELRDFLLRAILVYLSRRRSDLAGLDFEELRQLAEDSAQQALLKVLDQLDGFRGESKLTTWAYRVSINLVAGELRRRRYRDLSLDGLIEAAPGESALQLDADSPSPEARLSRSQVWDAVSRAIDQDLSERQQHVIRRVVLDGAEPERVAQELGTNRNNVYKILHDARRKLKRSLLARNWSSEEMLAAFASSDAP